MTCLRSSKAVRSIASLHAPATDGSITTIFFAHSSLWCQVSVARPKPSWILDVVVIAECDPSYFHDVGLATPPAAAVTPVAPDETQLLRLTQSYLRARATDHPIHPVWVNAWEQFYELHRPWVRRIVARRCLRLGELDDCEQEVWGEIIAKLPRLILDPQRGRFRTWLGTLVVRKIRDFTRRRSMMPTSVPLPEYAQQLSCPCLGPEESLVRLEHRRHVQAALVELRANTSHENYQIIHLRWVSGREFTEIGQLLNLTPDQVRYRHHRVKAKLRKLIRQE